MAQQLIDKKNPAEFNQAIMEFGARQCKPQNPDCTNCPFNESCVALQKNLIKDLPVKIKAKKVKKRYFNYLVFLSEDEKTIIEERNGKGIWQKLYQFPLIETNQEVNLTVLRQEERFKELTRGKTYSISVY